MTVAAYEWVGASGAAYTYYVRLRGSRLAQNGPPLFGPAMFLLAQ